MSINILKGLSFRHLKSYERINSVLIITRLKHINHPGHKQKKKAVQVKYELPDEYVEEAQYPPVKPEYPPGSFSDKIDSKIAWHYYEEGLKFHSLKTIQERLTVMAYLNIQPTIDDVGATRMRYYPLWLLDRQSGTPRSKDFMQYITKTHTELVKDLPKSNSLINKNSFEKIKQATIECIKLNLLNKQKPIENLLENKETENSVQNNYTNEFVTDLFNSIINVLSTEDEYSHLKKAMYGYNVDIQGYWKRCGFRECRPRGAVKPDEDTIRFQFRDKAILQLKNDMPLGPVIHILT